MSRRKVEAEAMALRAFENFLAGRDPEWDVVEIKSTWIEPEKCARRLAGHANAVRGEGFVWLFGIDEKTRQVTGVEGTTFDKWWSKVVACFRDKAPRLGWEFPLAADPRVHALYFEADDAPYLVANPSHGREKSAIEAEVPWREGRMTRTATRADLLRVLVPAIHAPTIELHHAQVTAPLIWTVPKMTVPALRLRLYVVSPTLQRVVLPGHSLEGEIDLGEGPEPLQFGRYDYEGAGYSSAVANADQCDVNGAWLAAASFRVVKLGLEQEAFTPRVSVRLATTAGHRFALDIELERQRYVNVLDAGNLPLAIWKGAPGLQLRRLAT